MNIMRDLLNICWLVFLRPRLFPSDGERGVEIVFQIIPFIDVIFGEKNKCVCSEEKKGLLYELACISSSSESKQTMQGKLKVLRLFSLVEKKKE